MTDADGEVRELTTDDLEHFRPAAEVVAPELGRKLGLRAPQTSASKERVTILLSPEVGRRFRATGDGWHARVDAALKDWLKSNPFGG